MRRLTHAGLVSFCALFAAACSDHNASRDLADPARSLVRVDVSYTRVPGADPRFDAQAHFVRYRSFDSASVPTLLGFADFDNLPIDSCRVTDGTADLDEALATPGEVSLLDAGRLDVRGPPALGERAQMRRSHYPELVPFVSGIIYGADDARPLSLGLGQPYQVSGEGGEEVGPFTAQVTAPRGFPMLVLLPLRRSESMDVRWGGERGEEPLLLEVKWSSRAGARAVRCRVRDDGEFTIGREAFESLPAQPAQAIVTATRVARSPVVAPGAGKGELTFELRDVAPVQVIPGSHTEGVGGLQ